MQNGANGGPISTALDEFKISSFLDNNLVSKGGIIQSYSYLSMDLRETIMLGNHMIRSNIKHYGQLKEAAIKITGVQESLLDTIYEQYYNPGENMQDPFNTNKNYGSMDIVKMLYDIDEYSQTEEKYDQKNVLVNNPNNDTVITSEIYNLIVSEGLRGLVF